VSSERRTQLVKAMNDVSAARRAAEAAGATTEEIQRLVTETDRLRQEYIQGLPRVAIAADPFLGSIVTASIDTDGLDGPFWDAMNPARPAETMPPSFVVFTGAMLLSRPDLETTTYLCLPGPARPFVLPALLNRDGVVSVLASIPIGRHTGYAVSYFSRVPLELTDQARLPGEWGRREYWRRDLGRPVRLAAALEDDPAPDFNLAPWIDRGTLAWVAPGDATMTLRRDRTGCPYITLSGDRRPQRVQLGQVW
jgi:hypothetical protein